MADVKIEPSELPAALEFLGEYYNDALTHLKAFVVARRAYVALGITDDMLYAKWRATQKEIFLEAINLNIPDPFRTEATNAKKHLCRIFG